MLFQGAGAYFCTGGNFTQMAQSNSELLKEAFVCFL
jgi:enoyl-CoA hydratase/carnithine racemase